MRAALPGPLCIAAAVAAMPEGGARGIALIPLSAHGCAVSGTQAADADFSGRSPKSAMPRACSLWLLSLARARESNPGSVAARKLVLSKVTRAAQLHGSLCSRK